MKNAEFFAPYPQKVIPIRQFQGKSPMFFRDLHMMGAVFTANAATVRDLLPTPQHYPIEIFPGRALVALHCMEYRESDVGAYHEISLSLAVQFGKAPSLFRPGLIQAARAALTQRYEAYVQDLPVTTEIALYGGLDYFNFPKYLARISFQETESRRVAFLQDRDSGEPILEIETRKPRQREFRRTMTMTTYPVMNGSVVRAKMLLKPQTLGVSLSPRATEIRIHRHPRAAVFKNLQLGRPLQTFFAPHCQAILFEPVRVSS